MDESLPASRNWITMLPNLTSHLPSIHPYLTANIRIAMAQQKGSQPSEKLTEDTQFPHIEGNIKGFLYNLHKCYESKKDDCSSKVALEGTVKVDGMHADIVFNITKDDLENLGTKEDAVAESLAAMSVRDATVDSATPNKSHALPRFQSRNTVVTTEKPIQGFPSNFTGQSRELLLLKRTILRRFLEVNPEKSIDIGHPLIVAGEWIGPKIRPGAGVTKLSKRFVILTISINSIWQRDADFANIEAPQIDVYNVGRVPSYTVDFELNNMSHSNPAFQQMYQYSDDIEKDCPFARAMGVSDDKCKGEGIVWKPATPRGRGDASLWFKTKGIVERKKVEAQAEAFRRKEASAKAHAQQLAGALVTDRRIEQGYEYLQELNLEVDEANTPVFVEWVVGDVLREEELTINESRVKKGLLRIELISFAREKYKERPE